MRTPSFVRPLALSVVALAVLTACGTVPTVQRYEPKLNPTFSAADSNANAIATNASQTEPTADFWLGFNDTELNQLVAEALKANFDIRVAQANLTETRASARQSISQLYPTIGVNGGASRSRERNRMGGEGTITESQFNLGFDAVWEAELFGRVSKDVRIATDASTAASEALLKASRITVAGEVTRNYMSLRGLQTERLLTQSSIEQLVRLVKLIELRLNAGRANALELERAKSQLASAQAGLPALDAAIARTRYQLAVLIGQPPTALDTRLSEVKPLPALAPSNLAAIGNPQNLLARRPDVFAAEKQALAAAARIGIARSQFTPRITLSGALGLNSGRFLDLGNASSFIYNLGGQIAYKLFDSGRAQAGVDVAAAQADGAIVGYERVVLTALQETEEALMTYSQTQRQVEHLFAASQAADKAAMLARARLDAGVTDAVALITAEQEALAARTRLAQTQTAAATSLIAVYKALAGGVTL